jgi:cytochrome P450
MLVEMRKVALLIMVETLFGTNFNPEMGNLWEAVLRILAFISPGPWLILPGIPRPGYGSARRKLDAYLYRIIAERRKNPSPSNDLLSHLIDVPGMTDELIRDQLLTMLIAGHDTSTALLAWSLFLLGSHPYVMASVLAEIDSQLCGKDPDMENIRQLEFLDQVIAETLRLYPPIHIGNRIAAVDLEFQGFQIPAGARVVYSIYLTHRQERYWQEPHRFNPERFSPDNAQQRPHYAYLPFGGGRRNCIGQAFAQVEVKVVLARLLQRFYLQRINHAVHPHMGATLEPRPGVRMRVFHRN